jgi:hypothetical protein
VEDQKKLESATRSIEAAEANVKAMTTQLAKASKDFHFYQDFREYVLDLVDCLAAKVSIYTLSPAKALQPKSASFNRRRILNLANENWIVSCYHTISSCGYEGNSALRTNCRNIQTKGKQSSPYKISTETTEERDGNSSSAKKSSSMHASRFLLAFHRATWFRFIWMKTMKSRTNFKNIFITEVVLFPFCSSIILFYTGIFPEETNVLFARIVSARGH